MTLEQIMAKLEGDDLKEAIVGLINAEKEKGITSYRKKDGELLAVKNALKSKGYDPESGKLDEWLESKIKSEDKVRESSITISQLEDRLTNVTSQWENDKKAAKESKIQAELTSKIGNMFYGSNYMIKTWINEGKVDIVDGNIMYDGKPFDSALETIKADHKDSVRVSQAPGSGDTGGGNNAAPTEKSFVERVKERIASGE